MAGIVLNFRAVKALPVLFLNTWYPNREDPWLGLFIRKQARALALYHPVIGLYLKSAPVTQMECDWEEGEGYLALKAYYPRHASGWPVAGPLIRALAYPWYSYKAWNLLRKRAQITKPVRIVVNVAGPLAWLGAILKLRYSVPLYWMEHWNAFLPGDPRFSGIHIRLQAWTLHLFASGTAAVSNLLAGALKARGYGRNHRVIPNVVNREFFRPRERNQAAIPRLAHISNFAPFKQADKILEALGIVFQSRQDFTFEFMGLDSPAKDMIRRQAEQMGLCPGPVSFVSALPEEEMPAYLSGLSGLVSYSTTESQGVVLLEAWAAGIPVIANRNMGAWELGPDAGKIEANPQDLPSLVQAIHHLLDRQNNSLAAEISFHMNEFVSPEAVGHSLKAWIGLDGDAEI